jgi:gamma-glutamylcyclotransferase (GGCT)/AIG2-like uncharacterized protein YtfP
LWDIAVRRPGHVVKLSNPQQTGEEEMFQLRNLFVKKALVNVEKTPYHTPDYQLLQDAPGWPVFEYGELKTGMPYHKRMAAELRCNASTVEKMPLWAHNKGQDTSAVALRFSPINTRRAAVSGELYLVPTQNMIVLDNHRLNGVYFDRKMVKVALPDGTEVRAFMYLGKPKTFGPWLSWDHQFYRGRAGSNFSLVEPIRNSHGWYSDFDHSYFKESDHKCYIGLKDGDSSGPQE